jgi:putative hydrolase of the HAD superfamily
MSKVNLPSWIVLDLDNTLYSYAECHSSAINAIKQKVAEDYKIDGRKFDKEFEFAKKEVKVRTTDQSSSHNRLLYFAQLLNSNGIKFSATELLRLDRLYWTIFFRNMKLFPHAKEFIENAIRWGTKIALVTDLVSNVQYQKIILLGLDTSFDVVITSEDAGGDKITGKPFLLLKERLGFIDNAILWFIGDSKYDFPDQNLFGKVVCFTRQAESFDLGQDIETYSSFSDLTNHFNLLI